MKLFFLSAALLLAFASSGLAQIRAIAPHHTLAAALGSPGIDAGDYVYISGQAPFRADSSVPENFADQVRQSLDNIKGVVVAAGLTMDHVVYVQVYLKDVHQYAALNRAFAAYFPKEPPARAVLGVARLPEDDAVQINAVAVRDLKGKQPVCPPTFKPNNSFSPGMLTHDRLFVSTMPGADPSSGKATQDPAAQVDLALDGMKAVLEATGLKLSNMVFVNPYLTQEVPIRIMNERYAQRFEFANTPPPAPLAFSPPPP